MTRTFFLLAGLAMAAPAFAGGALSFDLEGPTDVYIGFETEFPFSGITASGGTGLFVAPTGQIGPQTCPPQISGNCLEITDPSFLVAIESLAPGGADRFTITPPLVVAEGSYTFQAAAVTPVNVPWVSNTVEINAINTCNKLTGSFPASGATGVSPAADLEVSFSANVADKWQYALYNNGSEVATTIDASGDTTTITPAALLAENTAYTLFAQNICGDVFSLPFETGSAPGLNAYVGTTFVLDTTNATTSPPGLIPLGFEATVDDTIAFQLIEADPTGDFGTSRQGRVFSGGTQDTCATTTDSDVTWLGNGDFVITVPNYGNLGAEAALYGTFDDLTGDVTDVTFEVGLPDIGGLFCGFIGGGCGTCPITGGQCVVVTTTGLYGEASTTDLVEVLPGTCP